MSLNINFVQALILFYSLVCECEFCTDSQSKKQFTFSVNSSVNIHATSLLNITNESCLLRYSTSEEAILLF